MVPAVLKQTWVLMAVLLNMLGQGMVLSLPSVLLPAMLAPDSEIKAANLNEASWVSSCIGPASVPGFFISAYLMDRIGRKYALMIVMTASIAGWITIYFAKSIITLLVGRSLCGFAAGASVSLGAVVVGEFSSPEYRGVFLNLKTAAVCMGNMALHILGNYLSWKNIAIIAVVPYLIAFLIIFTWPESPAWLASNKKFEASEKAFYWLRGENEKSRRELEELIRAQKEKAVPEKSRSLSEKCLDLLKKLMLRDFIKPTIILLFCGILLEACGRHFFAAYALQIMGEVTGNKVNSFFYTFWIDIMITTTSVVSVILVRLMKRRTLFFWSGFTALFVLMCVCLYLFLASRGVISNERPWIPILLFVVYFILSNLGCTAIPLALFGELYPLAHRAVGAAVSGLILSFALMVAMQLTPFLMVTVKVYGTFTVWGAAMGGCLVVLYYILPETKDRTLQEIEDYFNFGRFRDDKNVYDEEAKMKMIPQTN